MHKAILTSQSRSLDPGVLMPQLVGGYPVLTGTQSLKPNYRGRLFRLYCATGLSTFIDIYQDSSGKADMSGVATWSGGSLAIYCCGTYNHVNGVFGFQPKQGRWPLVDLNNTENGFQTLTHGWDDTGALSLGHSTVSKGFSVNRANVNMGMVCRPQGNGISVRNIALNSDAVSTLATGGLAFTGNSNTGPIVGGTSSNIVTATPPVINRLSVQSIQATLSATKVRINDRVTSGAANGAQRQDTLFTGLDPAQAPTYSSIMEWCASYLTQYGQSDTLSQSIHDTLSSVFSVVKTRANVIVATCHSLSFNCNQGVKNQNMWKGLNGSLTHAAEFYLVGTPGQSWNSFYTSFFSNLTGIYDSGATRFVVIMSSCVNDVNATGSGSMGGVQANIDARAAAIYTIYKNAFTALKAQGSNVRICICDAWQPLATFWSGTSQDKTDKAACVTSFSSLISTLAVADGFTILPENTINTSGALGDSIHTNQLGETRRVTADSTTLDALLV